MITKHEIKAGICIILMGCSQSPSHTKEHQMNTAQTKETHSASPAVHEPKLLPVIGRFFPENKETERKDTLIAESNLQITIMSKALDSYVTNEFESDGIQYIDKYRDYENHLVIRKSDAVLVDTVITKQCFSKEAGQKFLDIATFHGYWFNKADKDLIELFGVISKPETDWSFTFYHKFHISTKQFEIKEHIDEEM